MAVNKACRCRCDAQGSPAAPCLSPPQTAAGIAAGARSRPRTPPWGLQHGGGWRCDGTRLTIAMMTRSQSGYCGPPHGQSVLKVMCCVWLSKGWRWAERRARKLLPAPRVSLCGLRPHHAPLGRPVRMGTGMALRQAIGAPCGDRSASRQCTTAARLIAEVNLCHGTPPLCHGNTA